MRDANRGDRVPLLCFPHAGAGRLYYARWGALFDDGISFEVVQYPEREGRYKERMPDTVQQLAANIHSEYAWVFEGPYSIWGHSMGTVVGYEVAKLAQRLSGRAPLVFFSSGSSAPCESRFKTVSSLSSARTNQPEQQAGPLLRPRLRFPSVLQWVVHQLREPVVGVLHR